MSVALQLRDQIFDRIARLEAMQVPHKQIAAAVQLSESRIAQILQMDAFKERLAQIQTEHLEQADVLNQGWDAVEEAALGTVLTHLKSNPDPDYALRAAAVANKAQRRGGLGNQPLNGNTTATAVIHLNPQFVVKLQNMQIGQAAINAEAKRVDVMELSEAETLLRNPVKTEVLKIFGHNGVGNVGDAGDAGDGSGSSE